MQAADADDWDRATLPHRGKDATTIRSQFDTSLAQPVDPRIAAAQDDLVRYLTTPDVQTEGQADV